MTKIKKVLIGLGVTAVFALILGFNSGAGQYVGGTFNSVMVDFAEGISVDGTTIVDGSGAFTIGNSNKTSQNLIRGRLKLDERPTGGTTEDYALQIRSESAKTSGTHWGIDGETHLKASGTTSLRGTQGVSVLDSTYTSTGGSLTGIYGQARSDGTFNNGSGFLTGVYGLIEASAASTASHVSSLWADSHQNNAITGEHELIYMSNNGSATMDSAMYVYGGNKITNLLKLNTVGGMVSGPSTAASGTPVKVQIDVDGTSYYINAYPTSNN